MRKKRSYCLCIVIMIMISIPGNSVLAAGFEDSDLLASEDYEKVTAWEQELLKRANGEIAYDKAIKVYRDINMFDDLTTDEFYEEMEKSNYEWTIPIYSGDQTQMASVGKVPELSDAYVSKIKNEIKSGRVPEDELEKKQKEVGNFSIEVIQMIDHYIDYRQVVEEELNKNNIPLMESEVYFFKEVPGFYNFLMALIIYGDEKYVISFDKDIDVVDTVTGERGVIEQCTIFDYEITTHKSTATSTPWLIGLLIVAAIIGIFIGIRKIIRMRR